MLYTLLIRLLKKTPLEMKHIAHSISCHHLSRIESTHTPRNNISCTYVWLHHNFEYTPILQWRYQGSTGGLFVSANCLIDCHRCNAWRALFLVSLYKKTVIKCKIYMTLCTVGRFKNRFCRYAQAALLMQSFIISTLLL